MELLFKTEGTGGNTELKEMLSFIDADLKLKSLIPDIRTATKEVIEIIGKEIYDLALVAYKKEAPTADDIELYNTVRYPIAIQAYRLYAPSGDVAHTNNGRKMRQDEGEKLPFEWLLDRDNKAHEIRFYRAMDELITFLDNAAKDTELSNMWKSSEAYRLSKDLFVHSAKVFSEFFAIESRLLFLKLSPGLADCEEYNIKALIGISKFNALKLSIKNEETLSDEKDIQLIRLIKRACVFHAMAWSMPRFSVNLYPEGVLQHYTSDKITTKAARPTLKSEPTEARLAFELDAEKAFTAIQKLLEEPTIIESEKTVIPNQIYGDKYFSA